MSHNTGWIAAVKAETLRDAADELARRGHRSAVTRLREMADLYGGGGRDDRAPHIITRPTPSSVGCTCGWVAEVPLGHSAPVAFLDQHYYSARLTGETS